jgi:hypothetical protein
VIGVLLIKILQAEKGRIARLGRQIFNVFDLIAADNRRFDVDRRAPEIARKEVLIPKGCPLSSRSETGSSDIISPRVYCRPVIFMTAITIWLAIPITVGATSATF